MNLILIDHVWQSTLFAAFIALFTLVFRANHAHVRFCLWLAASLKFLIPFPLIVALGAALRWNTAPTLPAAVSWPTIVMDIAAPVSAAAAPAPLTTPVPAGWPLAAVLWTVWACGAAILLARWTLRWLQLRAAVGGSAPAAIEAPIPVVSTPALFEPGLIGVFRPVLMLPDGVATRLTPKQLSVLIAHELCHWRRRDNLTGAVHMLVQALFWFHPLVWWIGARLIAERERACDETVLGLGTEPKTYAESLLEICRFCIRSPLASAPGVSGGNLRRRVERIMQNPNVIRLDRMKQVLLATIAAMTLVLPLSYGLFAVGNADAQLAEQSKPPTDTPPDPKNFDRFVGTYQQAGEPNAIFKITRDGEHLYIRGTGGRNDELFRESNTRFFVKVGHNEFSFTFDAHGNVTSLIHYQNGPEQLFTRVDASVLRAAEATCNGSQRSRYVITGGEVYDKKTDLTWSRCSVGQTWQEGVGCVNAVREMSWYEAMRQGGGAWRVPTLDELMTLISPSCKDPAISHEAFPGVDPQKPRYWSSTTEDAVSSVVNFFASSSGMAGRVVPDAVRLVRSGR